MLPALLVAFVIGYLAIALEHPLRIDKAASALLLAVVCWTIYAVDIETITPPSDVPESFLMWQDERTAGGSEADHASDPGHADGDHAGESHGDGHGEGAHAGAGHHGIELSREYLHEGQLRHLLGEISEILFFLLGAMTIVELVDANEGFAIITNRITTKSRPVLLWIVCWLAFFMSAVLDNLTSTIVMVSLLKKLIKDDSRLLFTGMVVVAANAGGAWTVIGDVTTTMLWIAGKITVGGVMSALILPSIVCLVVPLAIVSLTMDKSPLPDRETTNVTDCRPWQQYLFLTLGLIGLLSVPIFKIVTHLPPFLGMLGSLSLMWVVSEIIHHHIHDDPGTSTNVCHILRNVDTASILFFLGILLAVGCLQSTGQLELLAGWMRDNIPNNDIICGAIGLGSAIIDNVPLVAAGIGMFDFAVDSRFWLLLAYCAGTGGSCLIIGSAAGVAAMGLDHVSFGWYLKKIAPLALIGYLAGIGVYYVQAIVTGIGA